VTFWAARRERGHNRDRLSAFYQAISDAAKVSSRGKAKIFDGVRQAIAIKIIELAKAGECNPDLSCEGVVENFRERV